MPLSLRRRIAPSVDAFRQVASNRGLLRLQLASFTWATAEATYLVGLLVVAFGAGGTTAVAVVAVLRALPSVILAPLILAAADRVARDRLLRLVVGIRVACVAILTIEVVRDEGPTALFVIAAVDAVAAAILRPLRAVLVPALARSPEELVAANVATTTGDSLAGLVGPAAAALLLVLGSIPATFVAGLGAMVGALLAAAGLSAAGSIVPVPGHSAAPSDVAPAARQARRPPSPISALRELAGLRHARLVAVCLVGQRLVRGMLTVLIVGLAFDVLAIGDAGVGWLTSAVGLGGLIGGLVAFGLVGARRLAVGFGAGILAWGGGILLAGLVANVAVVLAFLAIAGIGKVGVDVAGFSLLQRTVPAASRGRVFGLLEGMITAALALGPVVASILIAVAGPAGAVVVAGILPLLLVAAGWQILAGADAAAVVPDRELRLLRGVALFRPLQLTTIEQLANHVRRETAAVGAEVIRQGEPGRTFYIVETGRLEALVDGRPTAELGPGDSFGEIALVRDTARTASVRALEPSVLVVLDREPFLAAVTSHADSLAEADSVIRERLAAS